MKDNFETALKNVLIDEGGKTDDPDDPGGRTNQGITQREYSAWRRLQGKLARDVWDINYQEVYAIYHDQYWHPFCDGLPGGVDYVYFDMSVNMGPHEAALILQRAAGVKADGHVGVITLNAVIDHAAIDLIEKITAQKTSYYKSIRGFWKFGKGWLARNARVEKLAIYMSGK